MGGETMILDGTEFNIDSDFMYTKPKINASGGKSIGILNKHSNRGLLLNTPLMLTWGVNEYTDEKSQKTTYDMSLQFPKEEYSNDACEQFMKNMSNFENQIKADALKNSKEWMNKTKTSPEVIDALWTPMLKYPKDPESGESDHSRAPTLRVKLPVWDGQWNCELYNMEQKCIFPNDSGQIPTSLIGKGTYVATVIQCGGVWFANGKFGVTWKLVQAVVKPKESLKGKCFISLSSNDKSLMEKSNNDDDDAQMVQVEDSSDEDDEKIVPATEEPPNVPVTAAEVTAELKSLSSTEPPNSPVAKRKVVRKKKTAT